MKQGGLGLGMTRARFSQIALPLMAIYITIILGPLAPLAMHSAVIAPTVIGECTGDCDACGCDPERSANHTCCCWRKKLQHGSCEDQQEVASCCQKSQEPPPVSACSTPPCGSGKLIAFWGGESFESILHVNDADPVIIHVETLLPSPHLNLTGRYSDPPDPPPKLVIPS